MSVGMRYVREHDCQGELPRRRLDRSRLRAGAAGLTENTDAGALRGGLLQHLQLLCDELRARRQARASDVPTRPRETGNKPCTDRVDRPCHDHRYGCGRMFQRGDARVATGHDRVRLEPHQIGGEFGQPVILEAGVAALDHEIPALYVARFAETLLQSLQLWRLGDNRRSLEEVADAVHLPRRLRLCHDRRREEAHAHGPEEPSPIHHGGPMIAEPVTGRPRRPAARPGAARRTRTTPSRRGGGQVPRAGRAPNFLSKAIRRVASRCPTADRPEQPSPPPV